MRISYKHFVYSLTLKSMKIFIHNMMKNVSTRFKKDLQLNITRAIPNQTNSIIAVPVPPMKFQT